MSGAPNALPLSLDSLNITVITKILSCELPYRGKFSSGKNLVTSGKLVTFPPTNFSNSSLFPVQFLKLKGLSCVGLLLFQGKVILLVWNFSN